ncbi:MAG: 30S ribosomal protein S9 [Candidatus Aenigmarchaeota archaeon]|nr:30S ribosomal protein S9 [Candidatus Aenigmarchaeota archaeon]
MPEQPQQAKKKKKKVLIADGKRKKAIARAVIREGTGRIRINAVLLDNIQPRYRQMRIKEAVMLAQEQMKGVNIDVTVKGGGIWGQADAVRTAIANALVNFYKDSALKNIYLDYDRTLLISDARRTEPHKPSRSSAGPRRTKQQSKR